MVEHHGDHQGDTENLRSVCLGVEIGFKLLSECGQREGRHKSHQEKNSTQWDEQKQSNN